MSTPFVAEIRIFPFPFAPRGWAFCDGQILPLSQNTALFSLVGTYYGGDGKNNFALPNLRGAAPMHAGNGQGDGVSVRELGESGGASTTTLLLSELPVHTHTVNAYAGRGTNVSTPSTQVGLAESQGNTVYDATANPVVASMAPTMVSPAGGGDLHNNMMPYLTLNFCIALQGVYPARS